MACWRRRQGFGACTAGAWMAERGVTKAVCLRGDAAIEVERCSAYSEGFGGPVDLVELGADDNAALDAIVRYFASEAAKSEVTGIFLASDKWLGPAIEVTKKVGADISLMSIESTKAAMIGVADGSVAASFDRNPYLEGYWAAAQLQKFFVSRKPPRGVAFAEPALITKEDEALAGLASANFYAHPPTGSGETFAVNPCGEKNKPAWCQ